MKHKSIFHFCCHGFSYCRINTEGEFRDDSTTFLKVFGNYDPKEVSDALKQLIDIRNTSQYFHPDSHNYCSKVSLSVGNLDFHYLGNSLISIIANKNQVIFYGEANRLADFADKCSKVTLK